MPINFNPVYTITPEIANALMRIEAAKQAIVDLPITPAVLISLRETARLYSTHYSTMIEGNRLTQEEVNRVLLGHQHFPGRERDEGEVKGYYTALDEVERLASTQKPITEKAIQKLHALAMAEGRGRAKATPYRDGQNVIRDARTGSIVYMPPEAKDVSGLMQSLVTWLKNSEKDKLPCPIRAGIAHYQFATIHPYYDGNGRSARLLTTLILHLGGYDLKGLYSLEEYYAQNLSAYYQALTVGPSHNYYLGRVKADISDWVLFFCEGMSVAFEKVKQRATEAAHAGAQDQSPELRKLNARQRKALTLFQYSETITAKDVGDLFGFKPRTASEVCRRWLNEGFLVAVDTSRKARKYQLAKTYANLIEH